MSYRELIQSEKVFVINCFDLDDKILKPEFPSWEHGGFAAAKEVSNDTYIQVTVEPGITDEWKEEFADHGIVETRTIRRRPRDPVVPTDPAAADRHAQLGR